MGPEREALSSQRFPRMLQATLTGTDRATRPPLSQLQGPRGVDLLAGLARSPAWGLTQAEPVGPEWGRRPPRTGLLLLRGEAKGKSSGQTTKSCRIQLIFVLNS